jgi:hypothetical protein
VETELPRPVGVDAVVFAVADPEYEALDVAAWLGDERPAILDANAVLSADQRAGLRTRGFRVTSVGRGEGF